MKNLFIIISAVLLLGGCLNRRPAVPEVEREFIDPRNVTDVAENEVARAGSHTARTSLDYTGTYEGILPCADCSGIETVLTLDPDDTYRLTTRYLDKNDNTYTSQGYFRWEDDGRRIFLEGDGTTGYRYFVAEGKLYQLDREGNRIEGPLADHYILIRRQQ